MNRLLRILILPLLLLPGLYAQNNAYVINGLDETLSEIDLETGRVTNHVVTLGSVPNQAFCHDELLYVVNSFSPSLMIIDPSSNIIVHEIFLPLNSNPWNVAVNGNRAYITGLAASSVYVVDLTQHSIISTLQVGLSPEGVLATDDYLYVTNTSFNPIDFSYGQGTVSIIDIQSGGELARPNVGVNPQYLAAGPDGAINVICTGDYVSSTGMVYFINPQNLTVFDSLAIGGAPGEVEINNTGIAFVAAGGWSDHGFIYSYNALTRSVIHSAGNPILTDTGVMGIAFDSLGYLFCACQTANTVIKLTASGTFVNRYNVGSGPMSLAIIDSRTDIENDPAVPEKATLGLPYPNPFNSSVIIPIKGGAQAYDYVEVLDITGRLVQKLNLSAKCSINPDVTWRGDDFRGRDVASGIYLARYSGTSEVVKLVLLH